MPRRVAVLVGCLTTVLVTACIADVAPAADTASVVVRPLDPRAADDAGLLVAIAGYDQAQDTTAVTLLLDWRGAPRLAARVSDVLVPRADGFRWVGSRSRCTITEGGDEWVGTRIFVGGQQVLWVARPGDTARVALAGDPCDAPAFAHALWLARVEDKRVRDSLRAVTPDSLQGLDLREDEEDPVEAPVDVHDYCIAGTQAIGFVNDSLLAYEDRSSTTEFCSPARYATSGADVVRPLDADSVTVGLYALLSARVRDSLQAVFAGELDCAFNDSTGVDQAWAVRHEEGAWRLTAWFNGATVCRGGRDWELDVPLPRPLVRDTRLPMPVDSLRRLTGMWDAATSPSGRWTLLVRGDSLLVSRVTATRVDSAAMVVPTPPGAHRIVMLRWLGAAEVERLSRTIPTVPKPVVRVAPPPNGT